MIPLLKQVLLGLEVRSAANLYGHIQKVVATALPRAWAETMRSLVSAASMPSRTVLYDYRLSLRVGYLLLLREQLKTDVLAKKEFVAQIGLDSSPQGKRDWLGAQLLLLPKENLGELFQCVLTCLLYTSPSPRDMRQSRMPSSA